MHLNRATKASGAGAHACPRKLHSIWPPSCPHAGIPVRPTAKFGEPNKCSRVPVVIAYRWSGVRMKQ